MLRTAVGAFMETKMRTLIMLHFAWGVRSTQVARSGRTITVSEQVVCALGVDQKPYCRGAYNLYGLLNPPDVAMTAIACGIYACCGLDSGSGVANCWGDMTDGGAASPTAAPSDPLSFIDAGGSRFCGIKLADSKAVCWGVTTGTPPDTELISISAAHHTAWGVKTDGTIACWGACSYLTSNPSGAPPFSQVANKPYYSACGLNANDNTPFCWGASGQRPDPTNPMHHVILCGGSQFACGLLASNRSALCWSVGDNKGWPGGTEVVQGPFERIECVGGGARDVVVGLRLDGFALKFGGRFPRQSWPVMTGAGSLCSVADNCRSCRDGAFAKQHPDNPSITIRAGGHCILNESDVCVDIYSSQPCSADDSACPTYSLDIMDAEYLEPVWYMQCGATGRKIMMGPDGCVGPSTQGLCAL